jgi:hypothetical protein
MLEMAGGGLVSIWRDLLRGTAFISGAVLNVKLQVDKVQLTHGRGGGGRVKWQGGAGHSEALGWGRGRWAGEKSSRMIASWCEV